ERPCFSGRARLLPSFCGQARQEPRPPGSPNGPATPCSGQGQTVPSTDRRIVSMQGKQGKIRWWPIVKALLGLAILSWIGWCFSTDLSRPELWQQPLAVGWLVPAALCYLGGMSFSALYWRRLLGHLGHRPPLAATFRAYFVGQLGK